MISNELNAKGIKTLRGNKWTSSSIMGIVNNEKYKGDLLMGKTFTVDPISKRRIENRGEEDRYYIKNHHEGIISEEIFEKAQEIRQRRIAGKKNAEVGKREKYSRQYAFSCMLECGFCGANLSRRTWHSSSKYSKYIWQCVKSTKQGKRFCPNSKGIPEQVIEMAFIDSYKMLCSENKELLEEFISRVESTIGEEAIRKQLNNLNKSLDNYEVKRKRLLDKYLDGSICQEVYETADVELGAKISNLKASIKIQESKLKDERSLKRRIDEFKRALESNQVLEEFDRGIFESVIDKVIIGGYDEEGNKDPYKITFIYKTGNKIEIDNSKKRYEDSKNIVSKAKELCSHIVDEINNMCSDNSNDTR